MDTRLIIQSNIPDYQEDFNDLLSDFIHEMLDNDYISCTPEQVVRDGQFYTNYIIYFLNIDALKKYIKKFCNFKAYKAKGYEQIESSHFTLTLQGSTIDIHSQYLNQQSFQSIEEQINILDYISTDIVDEQEDLKNKVEALYEYMNKSGLLYYKQMIKFLIKALDEKQIIDGEQLEQQIFKQIH